MARASRDRKDRVASWDRKDHMGRKDHVLATRWRENIKLCRKDHVGRKDDVG
jgi:hypothetical protein